MKISKKQKNKFIEAAREAECNDDEAVFDRAIKHIAESPPKPAKKKVRSAK